MWICRRACGTLKPPSCLRQQERGEGCQSAYGLLQSWLVWVSRRGSCTVLWSCLIWHLSSLEPCIGGVFKGKVAAGTVLTDADKSVLVVLVTASVAMSCLHLQAHLLTQMAWPVCLGVGVCWRRAASSMPFVCL